MKTTTLRVDRNCFVSFGLNRNRNHSQTKLKFGRRQTTAETTSQKRLSCSWAKLRQRVSHKYIVNIYQILLLDWFANIEKKINYLPQRV